MSEISVEMTFDEVVKSLSGEQLIFIAVVTNVIQGPSQLSFPPRRHINLYFQDYRWFRFSNIGQVMANKFVTNKTPFKLIDSSMLGIDIVEGSRYVVGAHIISNDDRVDIAISVFKPADSELTQLCMEMASVPAGWLRQPGGGWVYPIAEIPKNPNLWSHHTEPNKLRCAKTRRPALLCKIENILLTVEQIIPLDAESRMAPYGDGKFKITVTNIDEHNKVTIPALLVDPETNEISWEDSIIIIDSETHKSYCPIGAGKRGNLAAITISPKDSVSAIVNVLTLEGEDHWHIGGSRLYFAFAIGEMIQENFFYSYYKEHEAMHQKMKGKPTISKC